MVVSPGERRREAWTTRFAAPIVCTARATLLYRS